ncbi:uncharacterized protein LOC141601314 [Silene latifolia]|uniref:uncharacterized protein LOC141601314 n=1 Tax=Silene latifolia TaxID=37657 RepID=UPI003D77D566
MIGDDEYSISKGYSWLEQNYSHVQWQRSVWNRYNLSRHNFNQWIIQHGRLLTLKRLGTFGITQQSLCFLCGDNNETHQHLFHECIYVERCYQDLYQWLDVPSQFKGVTHPEKMLRKRGCSDFVRLVLISLIVALHYNIWNARNVCRLEGYVMQPVIQVKCIQRESKLRLMTISKGKLKRVDKQWCKQRVLM